MGIFEANVQALVEVNPPLASKILGIRGNSRFEVFQDPSDPLCINLFDHHFKQMLYGDHPLHEITHHVETFEGDFGRYPILFLYGIGNSIFLQLLLKNVNHQRIFLIEPESELLYIAFNLFDFSDDIKTRRIIFFEDTQITFPQATDIFADSQVKVFCKTYHIEVSLPYYHDHYSSSLTACNQHLIRGIHHVVTGLGNDSVDALTGLEWHLANAPLMAKSPSLLELIGKAKTTNTAVIVSTGPSLAKQLPLLQQIKDYVTILCIDASFPILEKWGIKPDIVFSIERVADTAEFYRQTSKEFQEDVICCISSISHPVLVESVNGATMQMSMRPFGYTRYMKMEEYGYIGIGMSAANMAYELAFHAKFQHIVLIGQDLAYGEDGKSHSEGHIFQSLKQRKEDFFIEGYGGKDQVLTSKIWNMFRNFFEADIDVASRYGIKTYNCTEGGARIIGAIEEPFCRIVESIDRSSIKSKITLSTPLHEEIKQKEEHISSRINSMMQYVVTMQKEVTTLFEDVSQCVEYLDRIHARQALENVNYDELGELMQRIDTIKANFESQEFVDVFIDATQALIVHHELELARIQVRPIKKEDDKRLKMVDWIYAHQHWLFALAGIMEAQRIVLERRGKDAFIIREAKVLANGIYGYIFDLKDLTKSFTIEIFIDKLSLGTYLANTPFYHRLGGNLTTGQFFIEIPEEFFDNHLHTITVKDSSTGIYLTTDQTPTLLLETQKIGGLVYHENFISYTGWCKNVSSIEPQSLNVWIDDQIVDSVIANESDSSLFPFIADKPLGFRYLLPETFCDGKKHTISFIPMGSELPLEDGEIEFQVSSDNINHLRKIEFLRSIENITHLTFQSSAHRSIGILGIKENLSDVDFTRFLVTVLDRCPNITLYIFGFEQECEKLVNSLFGSYGHKVQFVRPRSVEEIIPLISAWIHIENLPETARFVNLLRIFLYKTKDIYTLSYQSGVAKHSIRAYDATLSNHPFIVDPEFFGYTLDDVNKANGSAIKLGIQDYCDINENFYEQSMEEFYILMLKTAIENKDFVYKTHENIERFTEYRRQHT